MISKFLGEVETICLESTTAFSSFGEKEGNVRIWYTANGDKIPISMGLDLPVGMVRFELDEIREGFVKNDPITNHQIPNKFKFL